MAEPKDILIVCPIGLGNFYMVEPAIRKISEHFGATNCHLLALRGGVAELGRSSQLFAKIHAWDPDKESLLVGMNRLWQLRKVKFAWIVSLFPTGHWKYSLFTALLRSKRRAGFAYDGNPLSSWMQCPALPINPDRHDTEQNLRLASAVTGTSCPIEASINPPIVPRAESPLPCERYFVCHPGSSAERMMEHKRVNGSGDSTNLELLWYKMCTYWWT
jgi:ADP-heptose:LPS heptosyltransferase